MIISCCLAHLQFYGKQALQKCRQIATARCTTDPKRRPAKQGLQLSRSKTLQPAVAVSSASSSGQTLLISVMHYHLVSALEAREVCATHWEGSDMAHTKTSLFLLLV